MVYWWYSQFCEMINCVISKPTPNPQTHHLLDPGSKEVDDKASSTCFRSASTRKISKLKLCTLTGLYLTHVIQEITEIKQGLRWCFKLIFWIQWSNHSSSTRYFDPIVYTSLMQSVQNPMDRIQIIRNLHLIPTWTKKNMIFHFFKFTMIYPIIIPICIPVVPMIIMFPLFIPSHPKNLHKTCFKSPTLRYCSSFFHMFS